MSASGRGRPETGKFSIARWVWAPHRASAGTCTSPMVSCSTRYSIAPSYAFHICGRLTTRCTLTPMPRLLITGGAGKVATLLRPRIASPDRTVRLFDIVPVADPVEGEEVVVGSLTSFKEVKEAVEGVDAIIHFGGQSRESSFDDVMQANLVGTHNLFEAAREAGIRRVVMASSNHAAGFHTRSATPLPAEVPGRADTVYGWSKVAMEAMGSLYADRFGMDVICLRIGLWFHVPPGLR